MNRLQSPTLIQLENYTIVGIANEAIKKIMSKEMDMRLYWIRCRIKQYQFIIYWKPGIYNLGNKPTNHHSQANHIMVRPVYLHDPKAQHSRCKGVLIIP